VWGKSHDRRFYLDFGREQDANGIHAPASGTGFPNSLRKAEMSVEANYNNIDGIIGNNDPKDETEKRKSFTERLERFKAEAEQNAVPADGHEPHGKGGSHRGI
jgi:hypothetical protein